jgi:exodeoxyribonuclease V gamma subunit
MARRPLSGDRASRDDDRYLFLEALLSAREKLLITYIGQSQQDGSPLPPSVLVDELLDTLTQSFLPPQEEEPTGDDGTKISREEGVRSHVLLRHPLQPWSPRYFLADEPNLFSHSPQNARGAAALVAPRQETPLFLRSPLPALEGEAGAALAVDLAELVGFFTHPVRTFLQRRLGLYLGREDGAVEDREPGVLDGLERWRLGSEMLAQRLDGVAWPRGETIARAGGALPPGTLGRVAFARLRPEVEALARQTERSTEGDALAPLMIDRTLDLAQGVLHLTGSIDSLWPAARVVNGYGRLRAKGELSLWIGHLLLSWLAPEGYPKTSQLIGRADAAGEGGAMHFLPVEQSEPILKTLLELYLEGLRMPLPFFPDSSAAYAKALIGKEGDAAAETQAMQKARVAFSPYGLPGDAANPYILQVFPSAGEGMPETPYPGAKHSLCFRSLALEVFGPLLEYRREGA